MYVPSFLEIFLGWCAVVVWASWLRRQVPEGTLDRVLAALPWVSGAAVLLGQLVAMAAILQSSGGESEGGEGFVREASFGSAAIVLGSLVAALVLTGMVWRGRRAGSGG